MASTMRIAHVTATFPPYHGGAGSVCYYNALGLARLGHEVTVVTANHPPGNYHYPPEIRVERLPILFRIGNAPLLPDLLNLEGFDIIHLHYPFIFGAEMVWLASRLRSIPYILTHHNDLIGTGLRRFLFDAYSATLTRLVLHGARKFAAVSLDHAAACRLTPVFRQRWHDVVEIPNGVDTGTFRPGLDGLAIRREHGIPEDARVVLFVGALDLAHYFKGVDVLLKAFSGIDDPGAWLLIVGDGDLKQEFQTMARELGVAGRSTFPGGISHEDLPYYYAAAELLVLPSSLESFGLVLIEAMACGIPVVASDLPGVRSVVSNGEDRLLVGPGDVDDLAQKIRMLLADSGRAREMGVRGREKVETKYAWAAIVPRLAHVYESVLAHDEQTN